jgi:hypothetical protein
VILGGTNWEKIVKLAMKERGTVLRLQLLLSKRTASYLFIYLTQSSHTAFLPFIMSIIKITTKTHTNTHALGDGEEESKGLQNHVVSKGSERRTVKPEEHGTNGKKEAVGFKMDLINMAQGCQIPEIVS